MFMVGSLSVHFSQILNAGVERELLKRLDLSLFLVDYDRKKKPLLGATNNFEKLNYTKK